MIVHSSSLRKVTTQLEFYKSEMQRELGIARYDGTKASRLNLLFFRFAVYRYRKLPPQEAQKRLMKREAREQGRRR